MPYEGEKNYYRCEEQAGIKIWYSQRIKPEHPEQPIMIGTRKVFLAKLLTIDGAQPYVKID